MSSNYGEKGKPILYETGKSSCSWRIRAALALKGIDYEQRLLNPTNAAEEERTKYVVLNPLLQIPAFIDNGNVITQSVAILEYLEETYKHKPLLPHDPAKRAQVRQIVELINSGIQPLQNPVVAMRYSEDPSKQRDWQIFWIEKGLRALEKMLQNTSGKYCVGEEVTLADTALAPQIFAGRRFGADITKFPTCARIYLELLKLEAFQKSHPNNQPDAPADQRGKVE